MKKIIVISITIVIGAFLYLNRPHEKISKIEDSFDTLTMTDQKKAVEVTKRIEESHDHQAAETVNNPALKIENFLLSDDELVNTENLNSTIELLSDINLVEVEIDAMALQLKYLGFAPEILTSTNPDTGSMKILKSTKSIPGLKYFHAQIFENQNKDFIQHVSFEYRPGERSFKEVVTMLVKTYQLKSRPEILSESFVMWKLDDGHILWAKKQGREEVLNDPIYPHDERDIGTIKVAIEQEIH